MFQIHNIERFTKMKIQRGKPPTVDEVQDAKANVFLDKIRATLQNSDFKREDHLIERLLEEGFSSTDIASALMHHLRVGDSPPTPKAPREEERPRAERAPYREERRETRREGPDRRPKFENRRENPRSPANHSGELPAGNGPVKAREPVRAVPRAPAAAPRPEIKPPGSVKAAVEKTYSDAEILASVAEPPKKAGPKPAPKPSRRTPDNQTRLWMNVGEAMGVAPIDVVNAISGETGLPGKVVGTVDVRERHLFADVASEHVKGIIAKLNRSEIKGHKLKVKVA
jgi:ATP-dependent RNA helicase DeaD